MSDYQKININDKDGILRDPLIIGDTLMSGQEIEKVIFAIYPIQNYSGAKISYNGINFCLLSSENGKTAYYLVLRTLDLKMQNKDGLIVDGPYSPEIKIYEKDELKQIYEENKKLNNDKGYEKL